MRVLNLLIFLCFGTLLFAQSEPSTYFNIYVPPSNLNIQRNVGLIVTAINDSTFFTIEDDNQDGDNDDTVSGMLMSGQSYILYMKDNGINDDAKYASGGVLKRDGDYFKITSSNLVYASMSTDSDWQHDFVPSVNKKSVGQKFYVYAPKISGSLRDLNVFAYEPETDITIFKISASSTVQTGYTNINLENKQIVVKKTLKPGEDLIHFYTNGRDIMETGATYLIESNKDISVQYGALWVNSRDGGASVPSQNGSSSGEMFYFAVPYQSAGEQEIRIVSWDASNQVNLSRYNNGTWVSMKDWTLNALKPGDWVGKQNGNVSYPTVFRVTCTPGKKVSVFEANWMETGSNATSDMATMVSSSNGTSSGKEFLAYMLPPSSENNVINPATNAFYTSERSHFYLFAGNQTTNVTIKDAKTNGAVLSRSYSIDSAGYVDANFTIAEWKSIYNGTGTTSGPDRPYVLIEADKNIAVLSTNFNDNWMTYFGSSLPQSFVQTGGMSQNTAIPGDTVVMTSSIDLGTGTILENPEIEIKMSSGLIPVESKLSNTTNNTVVLGDINSTTTDSKITFTLGDTINTTDNYTIETTMVIGSTYNNSTPVVDGTVLSVETIVSGTVDGEFQQTILSKGIQNNASNTSNLLFSAAEWATIGGANCDSWNGSWIDYDQDGWEDLFVANRAADQNNELYKNNGGSGFTKILNSPIVTAKGKTSAAVWGDINNDGKPDVLLVNETQKRSQLFLNTGNGNFTFLANCGIDVEPQYFHGAAFADFDNDGFSDILITNFFQTRFHQLYKNKGDNTFELITSTPIGQESERATSPILADYDNDGLVDVFISNGDDRPNSLFRNKGGFEFEKITSGTIATDAHNSVGGAWGDYNNDGFVDLFVVNASNQNNQLYKNNGNGTFTSITGINIVSEGGHSHSASWVDVNNDGLLDLYITNDAGNKFLYFNDGGDVFTRDVLEVVSGNFGPANGCAWADYNRDGQIDAAMFTHGGSKNHVFKNNGTDNNWVTFELVGQVSNKMALGAKVKVKAGNVWQTQQLLPVSGFGSQNSKKLHFGLGANTSIDSVIICWPSGINQKVSSPIINQFNLVVEDDSKKVIGLAFYDANENGLKDASENVIPNVSLKLMPNATNFKSNENGQFVLNVTENSFSLSANANNLWTIPAAHSNYSFAANQDTIFVDLPLYAVDYGYDLEVSFGTTAWRRGFENSTVVKCKNNGSENAYNVQVIIQYPTNVHFKSANATYTEGVNNDYIFTIDTLKTGEAKSISIVDSVSLEATIGDVMDLTVSASADGTDLNPANNMYVEQIEVVGAIDPNDILVSPKGDGTLGYIRKNDWLTYTIRFENIGSWAATYVTIQNKLSENLDAGTFEFVGSSHEATYVVNANNELSIRFSDIDLPSISQDSIGANGYFKYRIKPNKQCNGGESIVNEAEITFDYEAPISTNQVLNTVKSQSLVIIGKLYAYPNPVEDVVTIEVQKDFVSMENIELLSSYTIVDMKGQEVLKGSIPNSPTVKLNLSTLKTGKYLVIAKDTKGQVYEGSIIKL